MPKYNRGLIFTNDNCIGCNKCVSGCPIIGANVSVIKGGHNHIEVDGRKCIHCGHCISACRHNAREYIDDIDSFFDDLTAGIPISLAVAPSFYTVYAEKAAGILGYLRSLGVDKIYDVGFGADIATYCTLKYFDTHRDDKDSSTAFISPFCPAVVNYVEHRIPEMISALIPVQSPMTCLDIYLKKYLGVTSRIAFINPCVAKKDELEQTDSDRLIRYSVTFEHLMNKLGETDFSKYSSKSDLEPAGLGGIYPNAGGLRDYIRHFLPREDIVSHSEEMAEKIDRLYSYANAFCSHHTRPRLIDILNCEYGCLSGPASGCKNDVILNATDGYREALSKIQSGAFDDGLTSTERREKFYAEFSSLNVLDFKREFTDRYQQPYVIPENAYNEIFNVMYKDTEQKRTIDCRSCGYDTCRSMVEAIAYGYNRKENCVHYMNEELTHLYYTDTMTGIANKAAFLRDTAILLAENPDTEYILCTADINNFKEINDLYGFDGGDRVLKIIAERAKRLTDGSGTCARIDSDHFAVCCPYTDKNMAAFRATEIYDCSSVNISFPVTLRFGIYTVSDRTINVDKMLEFAGIAMEIRGDSSRNSFVFYSEKLGNDLLRDATITNEMWDAIKNNEFAAYIQPQYNHSTGALVGGEILCRWIKPDGSMVSPGTFIPVFEKNGFITELDKYMWRCAAEILHSQIERKMPEVALSVNISRTSLIKTDVAAIISKLCRENNVPPAMLHLEITESAYADNQALIIKTVEALRSLGFLIAMDDFGTGYSSLNTLKDLSFDILKLDMGFLRKNGKSNKGGNIISSVIRMAQGLELSTVAEGVENAAQADFLKSLGCDVIQGYLYSKPLPLEQYESLLSASKQTEQANSISIMENLDINRFYDPTSGETVMFDHYSGAAIVFEYEAGTISIIRINDKFLNELGLARNRFAEIRVRFLSAMLPESEKHMRETIEHAIESGEEASCVTQRIGEHGESIWIKSHIWCIARRGNRSVMYGIAENISTVKNSEQALLTTNGQMNMIMDNSLTGICLFRGIYSGSKNTSVRLKAIRANKCFISLTGYTEQEIMSWTEKNVLELIHPLDRPGFLHKLLYVIKSVPFSFQYTYRTLTKSNGYRKVKLMAAAVMETDGKLWIITNYIPVDS